MDEILTNEDKEKIKQALEMCKNLRLEIQRAKRAGIDVTQQEKSLSELETQLKNIQRVYITG